MGRRNESFRYADPIIDTSDPFQETTFRISGGTILRKRTYSQLSDLPDLPHGIVHPQRYSLFEYFDDTAPAREDTEFVGHQVVMHPALDEVFAQSLNLALAGIADAETLSYYQSLLMRIVAERQPHITISPTELQLCVQQRNQPQTIPLIFLRENNRKEQKQTVHGGEIEQDTKGRFLEHRGIRYRSSGGELYPWDVETIIGRLEPLNKKSSLKNVYLVSGVRLEVPIAEIQQLSHIETVREKFITRQFKEYFSSVKPFIRVRTI